MTRENYQLHTDIELKNYYRNKINHDEGLEYFLDFYHQTAKDCIEEYDGDIHVLEVEENGLEFKEIVLKESTNYFLFPLKEKIEDGHSFEWANLVVRCLEDEVDRNLYTAWTVISKKNLEEAKMQLQIYCKSIGADEFFTDKFISLFEDGCGYNNPTERATAYCKGYNAQISNGKSEFFALQFVKYQSYTNYNDLTCYVYADTFEELISKGKSESYAEMFAKRFSDYVGDNYSHIKDYLKWDEFIERYYCDCIAYMKSSE